MAAELGVSYSHFRQTFTERIGLSPKQYHCQVRLQKAQELLASTTLSLQEVSDILGFHSAFQLSKQFKEHFGQAPQHWRTKTASKASAQAGAPLLKKPPRHTRSQMIGGGRRP
jgi:transcriptional regulator GlxA family with amidase domain